MTAPTTPAPILSPAGKAGYGVGIYGIFVAFVMVGVALMNFYTEVLGLSAQQAGMIFFIASIWDAVTDPAMGWLNDRVKTRWGRYRPWLLFGSVPFALSCVAMFYRPALGSAIDLFFWALILHLVFRTFYTAVYMPYTAMIARLSTNGPERSSIASVKSTFTAAAAMTVSFFIFDAIDYFGGGSVAEGGNEAQGFFYTATLVGAVAVIALVICFVFTHEPPENEAVRANSKPQTTLGDMRALVGNRPFWLIFAGVIVFTGCYTIINKAIVYDSQWNLGDRTLAKYSLTAIGAAGVLSPILVWAPISKLRGKSFVWIVGCLLSSAALATIYFAEGLALWPRTILFFIAGCGIHAVLMTFYAAVADAVDFGEWKTGMRVEAPMFGLVAFANKVSLGIGAWALGIGLESAGYQGAATVSQQTPEALEAIRLWMAAIPISGFLLSAVLIAYYPISNRVHARIERDLADPDFQPGTGQTAESAAEPGLEPTR